MSMWSVVGLVVLVLLIGAGYTAQRLMRLQGPTQGDVIDKASRSQSALLVLDVQEDFTKDTKARQWPAAFVEERIARINALAADAQTRGEPVITTRLIYEGGYTNFLIGLLGEGLGTKGSDGLELDKRLGFQPDMDLVKSVGDAFASEELEAFLKTHGVGRLRIAGLDGCYCVKSTALGALGRGYAVELAEDAVLSIDPKGWTQCRAELVSKGVQLVKSAELAVAQ
ncbi:cysteine hydrolase [Pseudovibrio sp. POLY-S9]|uniref:cysteine hydrolase family protein n=1 Tax=Pseudovibrio sp. POLY-S9 TaxID=1576596 RepID=UPI000710BD77|nr:cysteine hydrolase [Pseudovibrio sp. POLY-S9]